MKPGHGIVGHIVRDDGSIGDKRRGPSDNRICGVIPPSLPAVALLIGQKAPLTDFNSSHHSLAAVQLNRCMATCDSSICANRNPCAASESDAYRYYSRDPGV